MKGDKLTISNGKERREITITIEYAGGSKYAQDKDFRSYSIERGTWWSHGEPWNVVKIDETA